MVGTNSDPGIIPRVIRYIFNEIEQNASGWTYLVGISMFEIYNELVYDLLSQSQEPKQIIGSQIEDLVKTYAENENDLIGSWKAGMDKRKVSGTIGNVCSSRSHAVTQLILEGKNPTHNSNRIATITLVDLAGSESPKTSQNRQETTAINTSLSALNGVFHGIKKKMLIDYKQSALTKILKPSFEGNSKTLLISNISTGNADIDASMNTSRFVQIK